MESRRRQSRFGQNTGVFIFDFQSSEARQTILDLGSWTYDGKPLILKMWSPDVSLETKSVSSIPVWVRFPALQLYLWGVSFLGRLASLVGQPMFTDKLTADRRRLSYARVCFEVTADSELPDEVWYEKDDGTLTAQRVEYDWKPPICTSCKSFAHSSASCLVRKPAPLGNQSTDAPPELSSALTDEIVEGVQHMGAPEGEWNRVVGRKTKLAAESVLGGSTQGARQNVCDNSTITPSQMEPEGCMAIVPVQNELLVDTHQIEPDAVAPSILSSNNGQVVVLDELAPGARQNASVKSGLDISLRPYSSPLKGTYPPILNHLIDLMFCSSWVIVLIQAWL